MPGASADAAPARAANAANSPIAAASILASTSCDGILYEIEACAVHARAGPGLAIQEVQQKEIEGLRLRHVDRMSAPRRDVQGRSLDRRRKLFGHRARHQHIVACRHQQGRQAHGAEMRRGIEGEQRRDAPLQGIGALESRQAVRLFLFHAARRSSPASRPDRGRSAGRAHRLPRRHASAGQGASRSSALCGRAPSPSH